MSRQSQKTEVVNKINIRIGDIPRKRKRRKRTLKAKGFQHSSASGAFRRRTPMFAPTPMRPVYDGWARENMPTFQGHVSPHKKKESTTAATQTPASTPVSSTAQTPKQPISSGTSTTASPATLAGLMAQSPNTFNPTHSPGGSSLINSPVSPITAEELKRFNERRRNPSTPVPEFPLFPPPPVLSPEPGSSPTNTSMPDQGLYNPNIRQTPTSPFPPRTLSYGTGNPTPLRRARVNADGFSYSFTGR